MQILEESKKKYKIELLKCKETSRVLEKSLGQKEKSRTLNYVEKSRTICISSSQEFLE